MISEVVSQLVHSEILCSNCCAAARHLAPGEGAECQMSVPGQWELPAWSLSGDLAGSQRDERLALPKCPFGKGACYLRAREFLRFLVNGG